MRILALSDAVHPCIHQHSFPLPSFDLVPIGGDLPGDCIAFVATRATVPVFYGEGDHLGRKHPPDGPRAPRLHACPSRGYVRVVNTHGYVLIPLTP